MAPTAARRTLPIPKRFMMAPLAGTVEVAGALPVDEAELLTGVLDFLVERVLLLTTETMVVEMPAGVVIEATAEVTSDTIDEREVETIDETDSIGGITMLALVVGAEVSTEVVGTTGAIEDGVSIGGTTIEVVGMAIGADGREVGAWICPSPISEMTWAETALAMTAKTIVLERILDGIGICLGRFLANIKRA
jgi:hypothetical protein